MTPRARRYLHLQAIGCLACRQDGRPGTPADMHHVLSGGRRQGDQATVPLCPWHHRAVPPAGLRPSQAAGLLGPSYAASRREFTLRYGSQEHLLAEADRLLAEAVCADSGGFERKGRI